MFVDSQIQHALNESKSEVGVVITCSGNVGKVEQTLNQQGIKITGSIPEFLIINAVLNQQQLEALKEQAGIGSIELDEMQSI